MTIENHRSEENVNGVLDTSGRIKMVDTCFLNKFPEVKINSSFFDLIRGEFREIVEFTFASALDSMTPRSIDGCLLKPVDNLGVSLVFNPVHSSEGMRIIFTISFPKHPLAHRLPHLRSIVESMNRALGRINSALITADSEGRIIMLNEIAEELTGFNTEEVAGKPLVELFTDRAEIRGKLIETLKLVLEGESKNILAPLRSKSGVEINQSWRISSASLGSESIFMAFGHDPSLDPVRKEIEKGMDPGLSLLVQASAELASTPDPLKSIQKYLDDLVNSLGMKFGIIYAIGGEEPMNFFSGIDAEIGKEAIKAGIISIGEIENVEPTEYHLVKIDECSPSSDLPKDVKFMIYLPLSLDRSISGFVIFGVGWSGEEIESKLPLLKIFCNQILASLRNSYLLNAIAERTWEIQSLYEMTQALSSTLDLDELLKSVINMGEILLGAEIVNIHRWENGKLIPSPGREKSYISRPEYQDLLMKTVEKGSGSFKYDAETGLSVICVPLKSGDELYGVMTLVRDHLPLFNERDFRISELFSSAAAMAIKNALLYENLKRTVAELRAYNDLLTHDVANYNVPIHGYLEMLLGDPSLNMRQRSFIQKALQQSEKISSLVNNVRKLAEIQRRCITHLTPIDLIQSLKIAREYVLQTSACRNVEIRIDADAESCLVIADQGIVDLFVNLLVNACVFGNDKPVEVRVRPWIRSNIHYYRVDVIDQGNGVPDEWKERIFQRFWEQDSNRRAEGRGLGLSVVKALCELYGGDVWVEDRIKEDHSKGSVFSVILKKADDNESNNIT